jgi:release factor glutamine methyltransferase
MTLRDALTEASRSISRRDAETLLLHLLSDRHPETDRSWLLAHPDESLSDAHLARLRVLTARRAANEPLQHLTGVQEFFGLALRVTPDTLIPRPETEHLVEAVLLWAAQLQGRRTLRIADVGTGSGAIAIALAKQLANAEFFAIDNSPAALAIAEQNARAHGCADRIQFIHSDLLAALLTRTESDPRHADDASVASGQSFDAIVSNPPYVALADAPTMQPEVVGFEPHSALFAGDDGLAIYRRLIPQAHAALRPDGLLALEFGFGQREALRALLNETTHAWRHVQFFNDYAGIPRVVLAEHNESHSNSPDGGETANADSLCE